MWILKSSSTEAMAKLICLLAMLALAVRTCTSAAEVTTAEGWAQCGGTSCQSNNCDDASWKDTQCAEGFGCVRMTSFFWQCKPSATMYGQCGGNGGECKSAGALCGDKAWAACPKGGACLRQSSFYWQCVSEEEYPKLQQLYSAQPVPTTTDASRLRTQPPQKQVPVPTLSSKVIVVPKAAEAKPQTPASVPTSKQQPAVVLASTGTVTSTASKVDQIKTTPVAAATSAAPRLAVEVVLDADKPDAGAADAVPQGETQPRRMWPWSRRT